MLLTCYAGGMQARRP